MAEDSVDKVCEFLEKRGLDQDVVDKFRSEKMDVEAVGHATDDVLENLGLTKTGDRVSLRAFCQTSPETEKAGESKESKKRSLLEAFLSRKKKKTHTTSKRAVSSHSVKPAIKEKTRKVQLGWLHWNEKSGKFQSVRMLKGGGSREVDMPVEATKEEIIAECVTLFFPNGSSKFLGKATDMDFGLANFKTEVVQDSLILAGSEVPFTLLNYLEAHKTCKVRLYLTSRPRPALHSEVNQSEVKPGKITYSSDEEDDLKPILTESKVEHTWKNTGLIGSSEERQKIKSEQDNAYQASLENDEKRREAIEREIMEWQRKESLRVARGLRVPKEPSSPCITVQVRHQTMGLLRRGFLPSETMMAVYDWVGSQATDPEHFELHSNAVKCLPPSMSVVDVDRQTLYMAECEIPPSISDEDDDKTVEFLGYGPLLNSSAATVASDQLPEHFMEGDSSSGDDTVDYVSTLSSRSSIQKEEERRKPSPGPYAAGWLFREMVNSGLLGSRDPPSARDSDFVEETQEDNSGSHADEIPSTVPSDVPQLVADGHEVSSVSMSVNAANGTASRDIRILRIRRARVYRDMIDAFQADNVMDCQLRIVMVDARGKEERGIDAGGVYRDALSCFWQELYDSSTLGEGGRVPTLRHDFQSSEWSAVGKILAKGYLDLGYFPYMLSQAFIASVIFGENAVPEETLLRSFQKYIANDEKEVIAAALKGNVDVNELIEVLDRFGCRKVPTQENAKDLILEVAHKEIIQKPQYVADAWREALTTMVKSKNDIATIEGLCNLYQKVEPTNRKVLSMIRAAPRNNSERAALDFLKRFVRGMDTPQLQSFLKFVTGADALCVQYISVQFSSLDGLARRPIAHTCGAVLELPSTYNTFPELREEFCNILAKAKWQNDIS